MRRGSRTPNAQAAVDVTNPLHAAPPPVVVPPAAGDSHSHSSAPPVPQRSSSLGSDDGSSPSRAPPPLPQRRPSTVVRRLHAELGLQSDGRGRGIVPLVTPPKVQGAGSAASPAAATAGAGGGGTGAGAGAGAGHGTDKGPPATAAASVLAAGKNMGKWLWSNSAPIRSRVASGTTAIVHRLEASVSKKGKSDAPTASSAPAAGTATAASAALANGGAVSDVQGVIHELTVTYNSDAARYEGLPPGWEGSNCQFGVPLEQCPKNGSVGYDGAVPAVLVLLAKQLLAAGGITTQGVFRKAPSKSLVDSTKASINAGTYESVDDVHVLATLLKVWFRELPPNLLDDVNEQTMVQVLEGDNASVDAFFAKWPDAKGNVLLWLLDFLCQFVMKHKTNLMTSENMAIVWAPNLVTINAVADPMQAIVRSRMMCRFLKKLLAWRLLTEHGFTEGA